MAITLTTSGKVNNAVATTTLALPAFSSTATQRAAVAVALLDTTKFVNTIVDSAGSVYNFVQAQNNGTAVRCEIWYCDSLVANASNVITVGFNGATLASAAFGEYAGSTGLGSASHSVNTGTNTIVAATMIGSSDWAVAAFAIASNSGDTVAANLGNIRQSAIPALTSAGVVLMDNTSPITSSSLYCTATISASRAWAATALDWKSGLSALVPTAPNVALITQGDKGTFHQVMKTPSQSSAPGGGGNGGFVG